MCNEYEQMTNWEEYVELMRHIDIGIPAGQGAADLPRLPSIRIGDKGPVLRAAGNGVELVPMIFGFPPPRPKAAPVFNFRSEGRSFAQSNRCLIPATAFFEFTGSKYPKTRHRFTTSDASYFAIAGIWRDEGVPAFTMLTTEPGPDVSPFHDRQIVLLRPADWGAWLSLSRPEAELLRPWSAGGLSHVVAPRPQLLDGTQLSDSAVLYSRHAQQAQNAPRDRENPPPAQGRRRDHHPGQGHPRD